MHVNSDCVWINWTSDTMDSDKMENKHKNPLSFEKLFLIEIHFYKSGCHKENKKAEIYLKM